MELQEQLDTLAKELEVPGAVAGVIMGDEQFVAATGVTSLEQPLPVTAQTLFQFGSTGKTYTATAMLVLVERGLVALDATVRTYVPDLALKDAQVAEAVTIQHLFNHTAGWSGDAMTSGSDEGDDVLRRFVASMADLDQVTPLGSSVSYNNAALSLAGHVIERVTGKTYEGALQELVLEPAGLHDTWFFPYDIMTRAFVCGHKPGPDGELVVARPWGLARAGNPAGGMSATIGDQLRWAQLHLGHLGELVISRELRELMQQPTIECPGNALGDAIGISWLLGRHGEVRTVSHGGTTNGQLAEFTMAPDRDFAFVCMTNASPTGAVLYERLQDWAFEHYLQVVRPPITTVTLPADRLEEYVGVYDTIAAAVTVTAQDGGLLMSVEYTPETIAALFERPEDAPESTPMEVGFIEGRPDQIAALGQAMGVFVRDRDGRITALSAGGRTAVRRSLG